MKRIVVFIAAVAVCTAMQAQPGSLLQKAAQRAVQKATEKASEAAKNAVEQQTADEPEQAAQPAAAMTYAEIMRQLPELPTAQQYVDHKDAELNGKAFKLLSSKVTVFSTKLLSLASDAAALAVQNVDSAQVTDMAYRQAELYTGLSKAELDKLSTMSEEEQEAYLAAHYRQGRAEATLVKEAASAAQYLEPVQPLMDRWSALEDKVAQLYANADEQCRKVYRKYAAELASASDEGRNATLLKYYAEIAPVRRSVVQEAMRIRLNEELPLAEQIEDKISAIRKAHPDAAPMLPNYQHLTAAQYFAEPTRMLEIPEYGE
ncbi:MAG: hypothetical protein IJU81_02450 [Bacteroidales bacterium]|nr:hypothetical protein [Bacteroidales bacterium]